MALMVLIVLLNGLLGAIFGLWFRVQIVIPLIVVAIAEVAILNRTGLSWSEFWSAIGLISSVEMGYLIGASASALWLFSSGASVRRECTRHERTNFRISDGIFPPR
jgi:hypothetical protein